MNKITALIYILTLLFLFPSVSHSTNFKCEFTEETFKGGKTNLVVCSGDPDISGSGPRTKHCDNRPSFHLGADYLDFVVDVEAKNVTYKTVINSGESKNKVFSSSKYKIRTLYVYNERTRINKVETIGKSYLINFGVKWRNLDKKGEIKNEHEFIHVLYIPENGKSIITSFNSAGNLVESTSWASMRFGKCVKNSE